MMSVDPYDNYVKVMFCVALLLPAAVAGGESSIPPDDARQRLWLGAPVATVGGEIRDWVDYFSAGNPDAEYDIDVIDAHRNPHTNYPTVVVAISHDGTEAGFLIDPVSERNFLISVQSVDPEFLQKMGVGDLPLGRSGRLIVEDLWEMGLNDLQIESNADGLRQATWSYYWD